LQAAGALLRAVQMSGALSAVLGHCLTWVNDRVQFGRPIAKFQAVQHLVAELAAETAAASAAADLAVEASTGQPDRFAIAVAKARTGEAAGRGAAIAHQLFGAMGFTREHPLHYATRRLWAWRDEFGAEAYWQAEIGRMIAAEGGDRLWATLTANG
jgi:acyl-CoA dehydrogenase